jgi:hypothetical protein
MFSLAGGVLQIGVERMEVDSGWVFEFGLRCFLDVWPGVEY